MNTELDIFIKNLRLAIETGEILRVRYNGGSRKGQVRYIAVIDIQHYGEGDEAFWHADVLETDSHKIKTYRVEQMELLSFEPDGTGGKLEVEPKNKEPFSFSPTKYLLFTERGMSVNADSASELRLAAEENKNYRREISSQKHQLLDAVADVKQRLPLINPTSAAASILFQYLEQFETAIEAANKLSSKAEEMAIKLDTIIQKESGN